jgi:hypothetical protein
MKSSTKALARQMRDALLALPNEALVKTAEHWGALLKQMTAGDFDLLEEALLACGLQFRSTTTGQVYPGLGALLLAEPAFEHCAFVAVDPGQLRTHFRQMPLRQFYHSIVPLARLTGIGTMKQD